MPSSSQLSESLLEVAPCHGFLPLRVVPAASSFRLRMLRQLPYLVSGQSDRASLHCGGTVLAVPEGPYWQPPPPQVLVHSLARQEQRQRMGMLEHALRYEGLRLLAWGLAPALVLPLGASCLLRGLQTARAAFLVVLAAQCLALGVLAAWWLPVALLGLLCVSQLPLAAVGRANLEIEAHVVDALFSAWAEDVAWNPRVSRRYHQLPAHRLRWIHDTVTGSAHGWSTTRRHGKRLLDQAARNPDELLLRYPLTFEVWHRLHRDHLRHLRASTPPATTATSAVEIPKP